MLKGLLKVEKRKVIIRRKSGKEKNFSGNNTVKVADQSLRKLIWSSNDKSNKINYIHKNKSRDM